MVVIVGGAVVVISFVVVRVVVVVLVIAVVVVLVLDVEVVTGVSISAFKSIGELGILQLINQPVIKIVVIEINITFIVLFVFFISYNPLEKFVIYTVVLY
jgi:hypothetical protein